MKYEIQVGDNIDLLKQLPDNSIDSIVTDPPYGIEFLNKDWDKNTGAQETWDECFRVLKPGGHLLAFSAARTYHNLATNVEAAGFEIRDMIHWTYATGFPKGNNLKPSHEPITIARKPFKGSCKGNIEQWGTGGLNIDDCRIEIVGKDTRSGGANGMDRMEFSERTPDRTNQGAWETEHEGRYPTNTIGDIDGKPFFYCPKVNKAERNVGCQELPEDTITYDKRAKHQDVPFNRSSSVARNDHPTCKPVALMKYLITLVTPPGGIVLDPFCGSGSTGMAATEGGWEFIGMDLDEKYCEISRLRIEGWNK